jgi:hypothetical protein
MDKYGRRVFLKVSVLSVHHLIRTELNLPKMACTALDIEMVDRARTRRQLRQLCTIIGAITLSLKP